MEKFPKAAPDSNSGWSTFEQWAGIDWFGNKPATPPKERDGKHPITCNCAKCAPDCK